MSTAYRKATAYRSAKGYRGLSIGPPVVSPTLVTALRSTWGQPAAQAVAARAEWVDPAARATAMRAEWAAQAERGAAARLAFGQGAPHEAANRARWAEVAEHHADSERLAWTQPEPRQRVDALPWGDTAEHVGSVIRTPWARPEPRETATRLEWGALLPHALVRSARWRSLIERGAFIALPWGPSGSYSSGYRNPWPNDPTDPTDPDWTPLQPPILPVYAMIPTLSAVVLPARTPLPMLSCQIGTDAARWGWQFSGAIPIAALPEVLPDTGSPPEIEITINGYTWVLQVESYADQRRFGSRTATISGGSRSAVLASPTAPLRSRVQSSARDASQLAEEELDGTGWTLLWDAVDWLVPGGTWSYADRAPIDALAQIAGSIGARVETSRTLLQLAVKPTYPVSPWAWDAETPYAILPASILAQGDGRWQGGANANGVYVKSESGFGALVKITGTAGEVPLPLVVDKLLTEADPARERGRHELAGAGRIKSETLTLPLFPSPADPGLLPIGALVDVEESPTLTWRGQVMGVQINASRNGSAFSVRQTVQIERQFRD